MQPSSPLFGFFLSSRRNAWRSLLAISIFLISCPTSLAGSASEALEAQLAVSEVAISGESVLQADSVNGIFFYPETRNLSLHAELAADSIEVRWNRVHYIGIGSGQTDPEEPYYSHEVERSSGTILASRVSGQLDFERKSANLLIVAKDAESSFLTSGTLGLSPNPVGNWTAGRPVTAGRQEALSQKILLAPNLPRLATAASAGTVSGNFLMYVWGGTLGYESTNGTQHHRSGTWWENATVTAVSPRGVTRDSYAQFLAIEVKGGRLDFQQPQGLTSAVAQAIVGSARGTMNLKQASGSLTLNGAEHILRNQPLQATGTFDFEFKAGGTESGWLNSSIRSPDAIVDSSFAFAAASKAPPVALPLGWVSVWAAVGLVSATLIVIGVVMRRRRIANPLSQAELALAENRPRAAARLARRFLRRRQNSVDGWFVLGASLLGRGRERVVVRKLSDPAKRLGPKAASLAFLLSLAWMRLGRLDEAAKWGRKAARSRPLLERMAADEDLRTLLDDPGIAALFRRLPTHVAYA